MKLKKINEDTAIDKNGNGWFRTRTAKRHCFWITCEVCGRKNRVYWFDYPGLEHKICESCIEWSE